MFAVAVSAERQSQGFAAAACLDVAVIDDEGFAAGFEDGDGLEFGGVGFDLPYFQSDVIELVIGTCHARLQELKEPIYPPEGNGPVVSKSVFGHMIVGYEDNCQVYHHHLNLCRHTTRIAKVDRQKFDNHN